MDCFGSKSQKIAKRWRLRTQIPLSPTAGGFVPRPPFRANDYKMCKTLVPLKLLVDADSWQIGGKTKLIFYIFRPPVQKTFPRHCSAALML